MRTLVISGEGIGNMVETTPLISSLSKLGDVDVWAKPTTPGTECVLANPEFVKDVYSYPARPTRSYDGVFQTYSANTRKDPAFGKFPKSVLYEFTQEDQRDAQTIGEARANLRMIEKAGLSHAGAESFAALGKDRWEKADVVLHPGAYNASKKWPRFQELETRLKLDGLKVVDADKNRLPLPDLAASVKAAKVFVGNDSGPAHIAAAVRTHTAIIYGPTAMVKNLPFNAVFVTQVSAERDCSPCVYQRARHDKCGYKCLKEVDAVTMRNLTRSLLRIASPAKKGEKQEES